MNIMSLEKERSYDEHLKRELLGFKDKIIVLDDDPTGTQTVQGVPVYTTWDKTAIQNIFDDESQMVYILTNSRSFSEAKTIRVHTEIAQTIVEISNEKNQGFIIISRGDSTLRGHYPIETSTLCTSINKLSNIDYDGEIICPAFFEGGRITKDNIHYLKSENKYIPVAETEFSKDKTFGYNTSNLVDYVIEKSNGKCCKDQVVSIENNDLSELNIDAVSNILRNCNNFQKVIVNATNYLELKVFVTALLQEIKCGKKFLFRTAASFPKVIGGIADQDYLTKKDIVDLDNQAGGLTIIGSHVKLSSDQLSCLRVSNVKLHFEEFNVSNFSKNGSFEQEILRVQKSVNEKISSGMSVVLFTSRKLLTSETNDKEQALSTSVSISSALTTVVEELSIKPKYIIAKGGITSSDVATKGLKIRRAEVLGQISAGIPIWRTGLDSKFPNIPYIIFPGNVGQRETLKELVEELER